MKANTANQRASINVSDGSNIKVGESVCICDVTIKYLLGNDEDWKMRNWTLVLHCTSLGYVGVPMWESLRWISCLIRLDVHVLCKNVVLSSRMSPYNYMVLLQGSSCPGEAFRLTVPQKIVWVCSNWYRWSEPRSFRF